MMSRHPSVLLARALVVVCLCNGVFGNMRPTVHAASKVTVRLEAIDYDTGVSGWAKQFTKDVDAAFPTINLQIEEPPVNSIQDRLVTEVGANDTPDLAMVAAAWMPQFADAGKLIPWEQADPSLLKKLDPNMAATARYNGKQYGLPYLATTRAMFVNSTILAQAHMSPPKTWNDFIKVAQATTHQPNQYGLALQGTGNEAFSAWFSYFFWSYGGQYYNAQNKLAINSPAGVRALTLMGDLVNKYKVTEPNPTADDFPQQMNLFITGKAATTITGPWLVGMLAQQAPKLKYQVIPIPAGTQQATLGVTDVVVMFSNAHRAEAAKVAEFFLNDQQHLRFVTGRGMLPTTLAVASNPLFTKNPKLAPFVALMHKARFVPLASSWNQVMAAGAKAVQAVYLGQASPKAALDQAVATINSGG